MPTPEELRQLLGPQTPPGGYATDGRLAAVIGIVAAQVKAWTRGKGFTDGEPAGDLAAVILTATARLITNPGQLSMAEGMGGLTVDYRGGFNGFTLTEQAVLNRYRVTAV